MKYPYMEKIGGVDVEHITSTHWRITIFNPIYGTTVSLNDVLIKKAKRNKATLIVRLRVGDNEYIQEFITPTKWKKEATMIKKVFNYPNNPMIMWQREVQGEPS